MVWQNTQARTAHTIDYTYVFRKGRSWKHNESSLSLISSQDTKCLIAYHQGCHENSINNCVIICWEGRRKLYHLSLSNLNLENICMNIQELVRNLKGEEEMTLVHKQWVQTMSRFMLHSPWKLTPHKLADFCPYFVWEWQTEMEISQVTSYDT